MFGLRLNISFQKGFYSNQLDKTLFNWISDSKREIKYQAKMQASLRYKCMRTTIFIYRLFSFLGVRIFKRKKKEL